MRLFLIALGFIAVYAAYGFWQQHSYGSGPVDSSSAPEGPTREVAIVANALSGTVSFVDINSRAAVREIDVIPDGAKVGFFRDPVQSFAQELVQGRGGLNFAQDTDLSRDGRVLFVSRGFLGDVVAIDIASGDIYWRTPIAGFRADHMAVSPDGRKLYVSALIRSGDIVEVLDTATGRKLGQFETGQWPHDIHVTKDNRHVYVASLGDMEIDVPERNQDPDAYKVSVASTDDLSILEEYSFEAGIRPFQVTEDETRLFAQLSNTHAIIAVDLKTREQTHRIDLPVTDGVTEEDWDFEAPHHGLALSPDERILCAAGRASDYAALVGVDDLGLIAVIPVGNAPSWSVITSDGQHCILANTRSDDVSFVSMETAEEVARIPAGDGPKHITIGKVPVDTFE